MIKAKSHFQVQFSSQWATSVFLNCCKNSYLKQVGDKSVFRIPCPAGDLLSDVQKLDTLPYCGDWETYLAEETWVLVLVTLKDVLNNNGWKHVTLALISI